MEIVDSYNHKVVVRDTVTKHPYKMVSRYFVEAVKLFGVKDGIMDGFWVVTKYGTCITLAPYTGTYI
jgi:hypothetical protein